MFGSLKRNRRLIQWDGRRHSTRGAEPGLAHLWRRAVLARLAIAFLTAVAITLLACWWGPPLPYRLGEVYGHDLRVRARFEVASEFEAVDAGQEIRFRDQSRLVTFPKDTLLVPRGQPITDRQLVLLQEEHRAYVQSLSDYTRRSAALFLVFALMTFLVVLYVTRFQKGLVQSLPTIVAVSVLVTVCVALGMLLSHPPWDAVLVPLTITAMILTIVYNPQFALLMSFTLSLTTTVILGTDLSYLLEQMGGLAVAVLLLYNVRTRSRLVKVAMYAGGAYFVMSVATGVLTGQTVSLILFDGFKHFVWGTLAGFVLTGCLPLVERCFHVVTDISLSELADGSHPLMQELVRRAPGTYTHSITVATLAEGAAETIGANPLLTRVGSYFHDVGKMLKPLYFIENQSGENRHDALEPALSTLIITGHVKDGVALARQYRLPRPIIDFIEQHHGTTLVEYFYREALRLHEPHGNFAEQLEPSFRYPGPKPQSPENGIVMLADAVESTSRSLRSPTPSSIQKLVHDLLMKRLLDGQFEESGLTLTQLHRIEESLSKSLIALFHARIQYPEAEPDENKVA